MSIIDKERSSRGYNIHIFNNNNKLHVNVGGTVIEAGIINVNKWSFVVGTYNEIKIISYIDSEKIDEVAKSSLSIYEKDLYIGSWENLRFFTGKIDDIRIYNRALSEAEIQELYNSFILRITNNQLDICLDRAGNTTATITPDDLLAEDINTVDANLMFTVNGTQHGQFIIDNNFDISITNFTQQAVKDGRIKFAYDESGNLPSYQIMVSDGQYNTTYQWANITLGYQPILVTNQLMIKQGETVFFNATMLNATATNATNSDLTFTISDLNEGYFNKTGFSTMMFSFSQKDVHDGDITFTHDGTSTAPSYQIKVTLGYCEAYSQSNITFYNIAPTLVNNHLHACQDKEVIVTQDNLLAADMNTPDNRLVFTVNAVQYGQFEKISQSGIPINNFTQQEVKMNHIQFAHNGSDNAPSCQIKVSDGDLETSYAQTITTLTHGYEFPTQGNHQLLIAQGQTVVLTRNMLSATNVEDHSALVFKVSHIQHGRFERIDSPGVAMTEFTQQEIIEGAIQFVHDDSAMPPFYEVKATLRGCGVLYQPLSIDFKKRVDHTLTLVLGSIAGVCTVAATGVVGTIGFFGIKKCYQLKKQSQEIEKWRQRNKELQTIASEVPEAKEQNQQRIPKNKLGEVPEIIDSGEIIEPVEYNREASNTTPSI